MKLQDYKELLLNQDLKELDRELGYYETIKKFLSDNPNYQHNTKKDERVKTTLFIKDLGEITYYTVLQKRYSNTEDVVFIIPKPNNDIIATSFRSVLFYSFLPLLKSYDDNLVSWGLSWDKEKFTKAINKKWDKYFIELEKSLDKICGSPLEEVFLNNHSEKWQQSRATVFSGPKGKAILWTTTSGGYNIQQEHLRMFCKPLTASHIKEWGIVFDAK